MRVLYVAPRYHTNQAPIMKGWLARGHEVIFLSHLLGKSEDYNELKPIVLGFSPVYKFFFALDNKLHHRTDPDKQFAISSKRGFPPIKEFAQILRAFKPDIVIVRERSLYDIIVYRMCKKRQIPCLLYNQSPLYDPIPKKNSLLRRLVRRLSPQYRMTIVEGTPGPDKYKEPHAYFVPFVMEPHVDIKTREYFPMGRIRLLAVGRFVWWKNHLLLLEAFSRIADKYPIDLTLVGEVSSEEQEAYYASVLEFIKEHHYENRVRTLCNLSHDEVFAEYADADVFIMPSQEGPSVSQLEAMSCALPVICSNSDGKATYVKEGVNGYLIRVNDVEDLTEKMETLVSDTEKIVRMGHTSFAHVIEKYSFERYYESVVDLRERIIKDHYI